MIFELLMAGGAGSAITGAACYGYVKFKGRNKNKPLSLETKKEIQSASEQKDNTQTYYPLSHLVEKIGEDNYINKESFKASITKSDFNSFFQHIEESEKLFRISKMKVGPYGSYRTYHGSPVIIRTVEEVTNFGNKCAYMVYYNKFKYLVYDNNNILIDIHDLSDLINETIEINKKLNKLKELKKDYENSDYNDADTVVEIHKKINNGEDKISEIRQQFEKLVKQRVEQQKIDNVCGIYNEVMMIDL